MENNIRSESKSVPIVIDGISSYFVNIYYNHLYIEGKKEKNRGNSETITGGYTNVLNAFLRAFNEIKVYKKFLNELHIYFIDNECSSVITYNNFIDICVKEFVPQDFMLSLTSDQKHTILRNVLLQANKVFIPMIIKNYLIHIIDKRDEDNAYYIREKFIDVLLIEKRKIYCRFLHSSTKTDTKTPEINVEVLNRFQENVKILHKEKLDLKNEILDLKQAIKDYESKYSRLLDEYHRLQKENKEQAEKLKSQAHVPSYTMKTIEYTPQKNAKSEDQNSIIEPIEPKVEDNKTLDNDVSEANNDVAETEEEDLFKSFMDDKNDVFYLDDE
jgi:hypothetical protein